MKCNLEPHFMGCCMFFFLISFYFSANVCSQNYVPTKQDILYARKATKGIIEHQIMIKGVPFMFIDVGGQRSQRQKWFQCFEGITSILFLASVSEFDQVTDENKML